jgi:secondary thiamine-phosphate synthase enzyme
MMMNTIEIETGKPVEVVDITDHVEKTLQKSGVESGVCLVYSYHTTTGLTVNEADGALIKDILNLLQKIAPRGAGYQHDKGDGNAHAHLQATLLGSSVIIPVDRKRLALGTWQRILFFELDGPRRRSIFVRALAD